MFEGEKKRPAKPGPLKRNRQILQISGTVLISCYVASAAIVVIAVSEALRRFGSAESGSGAFYVALAVLGLLFSVFITVMNNRNKRLLSEKKGDKAKNNRGKQQP
ncbi:MAG: hypothetical protein VB064_03400 [Oscillospiraceae bacterium]|nr:hypothetical protein [Oscillospiraceae bacterium]